MRIRPSVLALVVLLCCPAFVQCSSGGGESSDGAGTVRFGSYQASSLDPRKSGTLDAVFLTPVYASLIHRTPGGEIEPDLATAWKFSADGKSFDLTLRDGVTFQDGAVFDAAAVKENLESAKAPGAARAGELKAIATIEVVDASHLRLHLSRPATQLIGVLAGEAGMMISPKSLDDPDLATKPVGAGPYQLTKYTQGELEYTAWDGYWNSDDVKNDKLVFVVNADTNTQFRALQSGQLNIYELPFALVQPAKDAGIAVEEGRSTNVWQLILNTKTPPLAEPEVRKAISLAIDRKAISENVFGSLCSPTVQPFAQGFLGHVDGLDELSTKRDLTEAKRLMAHAGYPNGFNVKLLSSTSSQQRDLSTVVQAQLKEIGISITPDVTEQAQSTAKQRKGQFDLSISLPPTGRPDPTTYIEWFYAEGGLYNQGFALDTVEPDLLAAQATTKEGERKRLLAELVTNVQKAGEPTVPLCNAERGFGHADNVSGFEVPVFNDWDWTSIVVK